MKKMKTIIIIILINLVLTGYAKQTLNLDREVQQTLSEIEDVCKKTNAVSALLIINNELNNKISQGKFILPTYACYEISDIVNNSYNKTKLEEELSNTNNIDSLMAQSVLQMYANDKEKAVDSAYKAYLLNTNRIDTLQQTLDVMINYDNTLSPKVQQLLIEYNSKSTNEWSKFCINVKYDINKKRYNKCREMLEQFQQKHPKNKFNCNMVKLLLELYSKKNDSKKIFDICLELYNNGFKDAWFGMVLGTTALGQKKYEIAVDAFKMCIDISQKCNKNIDKALALYGLALQKSGKTTESKKVLNEALKLNPTNKYATTFLKRIEKLDK